MGYYKRISEFINKHKIEIGLVILFLVIVIIIFLFFRKKKGEGEGETKIEFELPPYVLPPPSKKSTKENFTLQDDKTDDTEYLYEDTEGMKLIIKFTITENAQFIKSIKGTRNKENYDDPQIIENIYLATDVEETNPVQESKFTNGTQYKIIFKPKPKNSELSYNGEVFTGKHIIDITYVNAITELENEFLRDQLFEITDDFISKVITTKTAQPINPSVGKADYTSEFDTKFLNITLKNGDPFFKTDEKIYFNPVGNDRRGLFVIYKKVGKEIIPKKLDDTDDTLKDSTTAIGGTEFIIRTLMTSTFITTPGDENYKFLYNIEGSIKAKNYNELISGDISKMFVEIDVEDSSD